MTTQKDNSFDYRRDVISAILNELLIRFENRAFYSTEYCMKYLEVSLPWLQDLVEKSHHYTLARTSRGGTDLANTINARSPINHKNEQLRLTLKPLEEHAQNNTEEKNISLTLRRQQSRQSVNRYKLKRQMTRLRQNLMNNNKHRHLN